MTRADSVHSTPPTNTSAVPDNPLYRRTDILPEDFFAALGRFRRAAQDEIERLIQWLDSTIDVDEDSAVDDAPCDGDPDSEPSLGSFDSMSSQIKSWQTRTTNADVDAELDRCDDEPSLATSANGPITQEGWAAGGTDERESDGCADDREGDELLHGADGAREDDEPDDTGIGDRDGLTEQVSGVLGLASAVE